MASRSVIGLDPSIYGDTVHWKPRALRNCAVQDRHDVVLHL